MRRLKSAEKLTENDLVVIIIPDSGTRYLSKIYNDNWMRENQFLEPRIKVSAGQVVHDKQRRAENAGFGSARNYGGGGRESDAGARYFAGAGHRRR